MFAMGLVEKHNDTYSQIRYSVMDECMPPPKSEPESEPYDTPSPVKHHLDKMQSEIHAFHRGHQESVEVLRPMSRDFIEILAFVWRCSSSADIVAESKAPVAPTDRHDSD